MRPSERFRRDEQTLRLFEEAFLHLLDSHVQTGQGRLRHWVPLPGHGSEVSELRATVSRFAGVAASVSDRAGTGIYVTPTALRPGGEVNPIANWTKAIDDPTSGFTPEGLLTFTRQLRGHLEEQGRLAAWREGGLVGFLARFVALPYRIREAAGAPGSRLAQRTAFGWGVFFQGVAVAVVGGILTAMALALVKL